MRSLMTRIHVPAAAGSILVLALAVGLSRAEVSATWSSTQSATISGGKLQMIGNDPDPIGGSIWTRYSAIGSGTAVLNPEGAANGDGDPSILADPARGWFVAAWSRNSVAGFDLVVSRFTNGAWTTPQVIVDEDANALDPQLVLDAAGILHMFYWHDGASPQVLEVRSADLDTWSSPEVVSQPGEVACRPAAGVYQGVLRIAYEVHDFGYGNSPRQVVLARYDGSAFVTEVVAMTNNLGTVVPQVHTQGGRFWVDWVDAENGSAGEVGWTRLDPQGHWEPLHYVAFGNYSEREYFVRGTVRSQAIQP
jgi:hypothetical protein